MGCGASAPRASEDALLEGMALVDMSGNFSDDYDVVKSLGRGQQGAVVMCVDKRTGETFAMKETLTGAFGASMRRLEAYREIALLSKMRHPHVTRIVRAYQRADAVQVVMTHGGEDTLLSYLVRLDDSALTEKERASERHEMLRQLVDAVAHVHAREVVFRDLKHENVVVRCDADCRNARITLVDFGRASSLRREERLSNLPPLGTSLFQAPEVEERREYGQAADMWAVGVFVYFLTTGKMPFEHSVAGLYKVLRAEYEPMDDSVSKYANDLVAKLLVLDPSKRINAAQATTHRYLRQENAAHAHVSEGDSIRVPKHMENAAKRQLRALVMQESLERHTVGLLSDMLSPDDLSTLRRWLAMKAEQSVHRGTANLRMAKNRSSKFDPDDSSADNTVHAGRQYVDEIESRQLLNSLYAEAKRAQAAAGSDSVNGSYHGGIGRKQSFAILSEAVNALTEASSADDLARADGSPPASSQPQMKTLADGSPTSSRMSLKDASPSSSDIRMPSSGKLDYANRSFVGFAHASGLCTVDELITACISAGFPRVVEELQRVRDQLKDERNAKLTSIGAGADVQHDSVLLDIMLFRYEDLFSKVESAHIHTVRDVSVRRAKAMLSASE